MPKRVLQIKDYSGGLNSYSDPRDLEENEFQVLDNAVVDEKGIIRVSGALEIKGNIDLGFSDYAEEFPIPGEGLYTFKSDYVVSDVNFNTALEPTNSSSEAWGVTSSVGDGTWAFNQLVTNTNGNSPNGVSGGMAINYLTYSAKGNYNHGSLSFQNLTLKENHTYTLTIRCISEKPWYYLGSNIPPRLRIYNDNQSLYYYPDLGFTSTSDATQTALLNDNLSNAFENSDGAGGFAVSDDPDALTWSSASNGDGSWTASDNDQGLVLDQIDASVPVGSSADHKTYNSFFGTTNTSGNMTNGFVLKVTGGAGATATPFTTKQYIKSNNITVVANTTYLLDAFYNAGAATQSVGIRIYNVSGSAVVSGASWDAGNTSSWRHFNATEENEVPTPLEFTTPVGCTSIRIEVGVANNGDDEFAYFAGFNMRKKMLELHYCKEEGIGSFLPFYNLPNSWGNESGGSVNDSPYIPSDGLNPAFSGIRRYKKVFSIPNNSGDSRWNISFEAGKWGGANQTGVGNIIVDSIDLVEMDEYGEQEDVGVDVIQSNKQGHLIFYHNYNGSNTSLKLLRYNKQNDIYEDSGSIFASSSGKTNYRMVNTNSGIFFTDSKFIDKNMYRYYYNQDSNNFILDSVNHSGPDITQLDTSSTFANISPDEEYDALTPYLTSNVANNNYISMMSDALFTQQSLFGMADIFGFGGHDNAQYLEFAGDSSLLDTINQYDGQTLALEHDVAFTSDSGFTDTNFTGFKYDTDASWDDNDWPYTKYITIDKAQLDDDTNTTDGLITNSRIAKIDINLSHFIAIGDGVNNMYKDYVPNMMIYVDVVGDTIADTDKRVNPNELSGNAKYIATVASYEVNPNNLTVGDGSMSYGLGYENQDVNDGWITVWGGGQTSDLTSAPAGTFTYNRWHWKTLKHNDETQAESNPYKASIYIDYDKAFLIEDGTSTNLVVNDSTGVNLQLRFVPKVSHSLDFWHRGRGASMTMENSWPSNRNDSNYTQTPAGILSEAWRIDDIKIQSYKSSGVNANLSTFYTNVGQDNIKMNVHFDTPSKGEADGWEDEWQVALTTVNKDGVESALGADSRRVSNTDITKSPDIDFVLLSTNSLLKKNKEIKGYMKSSRNPNYHLQFIIDCKKMEIYSSTSEQRRSPFISDNIAIFSLNSKDLLLPNEIDSYESQTGLDIEVGRNKENMKCLFKTAVVANNILYAGNVFQNGTHYPDRMIKSLTGKFSVLPSTNFIDVAIHDGDEIISLQFYKDKLLQFKRNKVYIINVSEDYEYLENTVENVGVAKECQVITTPYGIAWINQRGCYLYDGEKIENLIEGKLSYKSWKDSESSWSINEEKGASITYLNKDDKLLIYCTSDKDAAQLGGIEGFYTTIESYDYLSGLGYQYDFKNKSWNNITSFDETYQNEDIYDFTLEGKNRTSPTNQMITNFALDENGDSIAILKSSNAVVKWDDNPKQTSGYLDMQGYTQSSKKKLIEILE